MSNSRATNGWLFDKQGLLLAGLCLILSCKKDRPGKDGDELAWRGTCQGVAMSGGLEAVNGYSYRYESAGGTVIRLERGANGGLTITMTILAYPEDHYASVEFWGSVSDAVPYAISHENLNGKHIKDRIGSSRSVIFPDGLKITCSAPGQEESVTTVSIYEGAASHHFNVSCGKWEYSGAVGTIAKAMDDLQPDGETSMFEWTGDQLIFYNAYTEQTPGKKVYERVDLGGLTKGMPKQINDFYDDPRIGHT